MYEVGEGYGSSIEFSLRLAHASSSAVLCLKRQSRAWDVFLAMHRGMEVEN